MKKEEVNKQIKEVVRPNGKGEINGNNLQETLLLMNNNAANDEDTTSKLNLKANQKETDEKLALKADKTSVYTKEEANALLDLKVNIKDYEADKEDSSKEKKELDIKLTQTKQELDSVKNSLSHMGNGVIGEAEGGSIISLPNNSMKSVVPNYKIEGLTVQNLVKNGDFKEGLKGWTIEGDKNSSLNDGVLTLIGGTTALNPTYASHLKGEKLFVNFEFYLEKDSDSIKVNYNQGSVPTYTGKKGWNKYSGFIQNEGNIFNTKFLRGSADVESFKITNYMAFNLTKMFGAGNEPSKEWCDAHLPDYVEGTKSVQLPMRVRSYGANYNGLFNLGGVYRVQEVFFNNEEIGGVSFGKASYLKADGSINIKPKYIKVENIKGEVYAVDVHFLDRDNTKIEGQWIALKNNTFFKIKDIACDKISILFYIKDDNIGDKTRARYYLSNNQNSEEYTESTGYITNDIELQSLPSTKDYIKDGKLYKNIKRHCFTKEDEWKPINSYEGDNFRYYMTLPFKYKATGAGVEGELFCNNFTPTSNVPNALAERDSNTIALYGENASTIYLTLDKKVTDVNSEIPEGTFIDVILPQTEVINLNKSGLIEANPNGTVFFEPITNITGFYDNGLDVEGLDILEVEEFSHLVNGVYQNLDVSKVKVEGGKLTHPDAQNGIVYLVYRYDDNAVWGENTISYYNSDKTLKSPNGKIWKKVESATDTGELVVTLEEVKEEIVEP